MIEKIVRFWENFPKSKRPNLKSYINVKTSLDDPLIIAKLHFFCYVPGIVELLLKQFQTDKPMISFLLLELKTIITNKQPEVIESCKSVEQLKEIDLSVISPRKYDKAISDFKFFFVKGLSRYAAEFQSFQPGRDWLDNFYLSTIQISKY